MRAVKGLLKRTLSALGYEVHRKQVTSAAGMSVCIDKERSATEYDKVWSADGRLGSYLNEEREALYRRILDFVVERGFAKDINSLADVGCGSGHFTKLLADRFVDQRIVGFDFSAEALRIARSVCPRAIFFQQDIYAPIDDQFDALFCIEVLEHLSYPGKALDRLLAAASNVILSIPNGRLDTFGGHINYWSLESWRVFLEHFRHSVDYELTYACNGHNIITHIKRRVTPSCGL